MSNIPDLSGLDSFESLRAEYEDKSRGQSQVTQLLGQRLLQGERKIVVVY